VSKRTFWIALGLAFAALFLLPSFFVGLLAVVNGLGTGNGRLATTGAAFAGVAMVLSGVIGWLVRRSRPRD